MNPYWVTFYSYKGGVGRTLALVNGAVLLARSGRNVLLVDFDLEAPGLDSFSELGLTVGTVGVVEYFSDFVASKRAPNLRIYVQEPETKFESKGKIFVMPSGRKDREYNRQRDALNWAELYDSDFGQLMIEEWKATIAAIYQVDYVFVDSRTGLTDSGGVCTLHLPDLVVTLLALNRQNIDGVASVISAIERAQITIRPEILTAATPVPSSSIDNAAVDDAIRSAEVAIGRKIDLRISYNPTAALSEKIFVVDGADGRTQLALEYDSLVDEIKAKNTGGLDSLLQQSEAARENDDEGRALEISIALERDFGSRSDALLELAEVARRFRGRTKALDLWEKAFAQDPTLVAALNPLVNAAKAEKQYDRVIALCDKYLTALPSSKYGDVDVGLTKAEALMAASKPAQAVPYYLTAAEADATELTRQFNLAEAIRRSTGRPDTADWQKVIKLFEGHRPSKIQQFDVNYFQAMHIAYACLGDVDSALKVLNQACRLAESVPEYSSIYSVRTYSFVKKSEILAENEMYLAALSKKELWDGMKLPAARLILSTPAAVAEAQS
jgi:MinD-like ATPase involved in chromosome partitioning or flagellar assembly